MAHARRRQRCCALAAGLDRISCLPALLQLLQRHLWLTRRRDHTDALVVLHRRRSIDWWRSKLRNRERRRQAGRTRSEREGRESPERKRRRRPGGLVNGRCRGRFVVVTRLCASTPRLSSDSGRTLRPLLRKEFEDRNAVL